MADSRRNMLMQFLSKGMDTGADAGKAMQSDKRNQALQELLIGKKAEADAAEEQRAMEGVKALQRANPKAAVTFKGAGINPESAVNLKALLTPAQQSAEQAAGKTIEDYQAGGGKASFDKNLSLMEQTAKELEQSPTGFGTRAAGFLPKAMRDVLVPEDVAREDRIRTAVQATLRQTLGAQFTEKEAERMMERSYNPRLSAQENIQRITAAANELKQRQQQIENAQGQYQRTGYATMGEQPTSPQAPAQTPTSNKAKLPGESPAAYLARMKQGR